MQYAERERDVARLAKDIKTSGPDNDRVREKRSRDLGVGYDEKTSYSGVLRKKHTSLPTSPWNVHAALHISVSSGLASPMQPVTRSDS